MTKLKLLLFTVLVFNSDALNASHINSGNLSVKFYDSFENDYRYQIILELYSNCDTNYKLFPNYTICIYDLDNNSTISNTVTLNKSSEESLYACYGTCILKHTYVNTVRFKPNSNGYIVKFENCCRSINNNMMENQNGNQVQGFRLDCFFNARYKIRSASVFSENYGSSFGVINNLNSNLLDLKLWASCSQADSSRINLLLPRVTLNTNTINSCDYIIPKDTPTLMKSGFDGQFIFGQGGILEYKSLDSTLNMKADQTGYYAFSLQHRQFKNKQLIYQNNYELLMNNRVAYEGPSVILQGGKMSGNSMRFSWIIDCVFPKVKKLVLQKKTGSSGSLSPFFTLNPDIRSVDETGMQYNTYMYYRLMVIKDNDDTLYSNVVTVYMKSNSDLSTIVDSSFILYPNPVSDHLQIRIHGTVISSVSIYDITGRTVFCITPVNSQNELMISVSELPKGMYWIKVESPEQIYSTRKLVIE